MPKRKSAKSAGSSSQLFDVVAPQRAALNDTAYCLPETHSYPVRSESVRSEPENVPLALVVSDVHLSTLPPTLHADNLDWFGHIERNFEWLFGQAKEFNVPILIAGDVFDKAITDSRLLSFVISLFRRSPQPIYTIPGNHDLPFHSIDRVEESGYAVLVKSGVLIDCSDSQLYTRNNTSVQVHGYHWLKPFDSPIVQNPDAIQIALVHRMITDGTAGWYPGCEKHTVNTVMRDFRHYFHYTVFGDNHVPFEYVYNQVPEYMGVFADFGRKMHVLNPGSFIRRNKGDLELTTRAYVLQSRGIVKLDVPTDIARSGEVRGNTDAKRAAVDEPEGLQANAAFASLSSFFSETEDGVYVAPDIQAQYRQYVSVIQPSENVQVKLNEITGIVPH